MIRLGSVGVGQIVAGRRDHLHAALDQHQDAKLLRYQIACETARILDKHDTDAIVLDTIEQRGETRTGFDLVCAADGWIVEPVDDIVAGLLV